MPDTRRLRPVLRVGQHTSQTREFRIVDPDGDPVNVTDADVTLTMEHDRLAYTAIDGEPVTIVDGVGGFVEFTFTEEDTALHGRYRVQFEVTYSDGETALYPPDDHTWVLDVGRRIPETQPLTVPSVSADEGTYGSLQVGEIEIEEASISEVVGDPDIGDLSIDSLDVDALAGGIVGDRGPLIRLDGPNLYIDANGELAAIDPVEDGYAEGSDHDHSETGSGGDTLRPAVAVIAEELALPEYSDVTTAPQTPGRVVYATGAGASTEGIYKHDGDAYQRVLVAGEDFDGQGTSSLENLQAVSTDSLQHTSTDSVSQSVYANVSAGRPVIIADGVGAYSVAFDDYASDDAAIQHLVDWATPLNYAYELHIPHFRPDGEPISIEDTISLASTDHRTVAEVYVHPGRWDGDRGIQTTINDGSPLFDFTDAGQQSCFRGGRYRFYGNDATLLEFAHTVGWTARDFWLEDFQGSGVRVNSGSFGWVIDDCRIRPQNPSGIAVELRNDDTNSPGYGAIGSGVVTETEHEASFMHAPGGRNVRISGHFEQATGEAMVNVPAGGDVTIEPGAQVGITDNGCHGVSVMGDGARLYASGTYDSLIDGDAIRVGGEGADQVYNFQIANNALFKDPPGGYAINVPYRPQQPSVVPYPNTVNGSVSYPPIGEWYDLSLPDGRTPHAGGTVTVPAGSVVTPEQWLMPPDPSTDYSWDLDWWVEEVPGDVTGEARLDAQWGLHAGNNRMSLSFEELAGDGQDVVVSYIVYRQTPIFEDATA